MFSAGAGNPAVKGLSMLFVYLCEDEAQERRNLEKLIRNTILIDELDMKLIQSVAGPDELLRAVKADTTPGLYFLDIDLKASMNGLDLALELRKKDPRGFIVFITSKSDMAPLAFQYKAEALDYICKDNAEDLANRVRHCIHTALERYRAPQNQFHDTITIKVQGAVYTYPKKEIYFIETTGQPHKIRLHLQNKRIEIPAVLKEIENQLGECFVRCHKSCIVNKSHIRSVDKCNCQIILDNGMICPCSTRFAKKGSYI